MLTRKSKTLPLVALLAPLIFHWITGVHSFVNVSHPSVTFSKTGMNQKCCRVQSSVHSASNSNANANTNTNVKKQRTKKKKNRKRVSQQEIHNLIENIGLKPVVTQQPQLNNGPPPKSKQYQSPQLSLKTQLQYARKGHTVVRNAIPAHTLHEIKKDLSEYCSQQELASWQQKVEVALELPFSEVTATYKTKAACQQALQEHSSDGIVEIPFLQHFNTWRSIPSVRSLATSEPLALYAKTLLDVPSVKLYQDSLFLKRGNDGPTPWHSDARMAPFDTSKMVTFWMPLDPIAHIDEGGTGLFFVSGSHSDFALPFWNRNEDDTGGEYDRLDIRYGDDSVEDHMPMNVGDLTAHAGWTLHGANGGIGAMDRYALAVTYVDSNAEIREDVSSSVGHSEDRRSYSEWVDEVMPRSYFEHDLVPIVYPKNNT